MEVSSYGVQRTATCLDSSFERRPLFTVNPLLVSQDGLPAALLPPRPLLCLRHPDAFPSTPLDVSQMPLRRARPQILGLLAPPLALVLHLILIDRPHLRDESLEVLAELVVDADGFLLDILASPPLPQVADFVMPRLHGVDEVLEPLLLGGHPSTNELPGSEVVRPSRWEWCRGRRLCEQPGSRISVHLALQLREQIYLVNRSRGSRGCRVRSVGGGGAGEVL